MVGSFTKQKWLERRKYHNEQALSLQHSHKFFANAEHPVCCEGDAVEVELEKSIPSSNCCCVPIEKR